jgi:hypothetical protein
MDQVEGGVDPGQGLAQASLVQQVPLVNLNEGVLTECPPKFSLGAHDAAHMKALAPQGPQKAPSHETSGTGQQDFGIPFIHGIGPS